jgi:hypothetical protein
MHFFRASVIFLLFAIAHSLPLLPQPFSRRSVQGGGDIRKERVPCQHPRLPADSTPSAPSNNDAHDAKPDQQIITSPEPKLDSRDVHIKGTKQGQVDGADVRVKGTKQGQVEGGDGHVKGTKQGQVDDEVNRSPDGSKEQRDVDSGKRIH